MTMMDTPTDKVKLVTVTPDAEKTITIVPEFLILLIKRMTTMQVFCVTALSTITGVCSNNRS